MKKVVEFVVAGIVGLAMLPVLVFLIWTVIVLAGIGVGLNVASKLFEHIGLESLAETSSKYARYLMHDMPKYLFEWGEKIEEEMKEDD